MNNDYLDNQDKYLYGVCRGDSVEDAYDSTYYNTIKQALLAAIPCLTEYSPAEVKIAVCERGGTCSSQANAMLLMETELRIYWINLMRCYVMSLRMLSCLIYHMKKSKN